MEPFKSISSSWYRSQIQILECNFDHGEVPNIQELDNLQGIMKKNRAILKIANVLVLLYPRTSCNVGQYKNNACE